MPTPTSVARGFAISALFLPSERLGEIPETPRRFLVLRAYLSARINAPPAAPFMVALNSGVAGLGFLAPQLVSSFFSKANGWGYPQYLSTARVTDVNGDGLADFCERGAAQVFCAFSTNRTLGAPKLLPAQPVMSFAGPENIRNHWMNLSYGTTFDLIHIRGRTIAATAVPTGVIFSQATYNDPNGWQFSSRYRYLCNDCFTTPGWASKRQASAILWGDFDGSGNDSPCFVRLDGLDVSLVQIVP